MKTFPSRSFDTLPLSPCEQRDGMVGEQDNGAEMSGVERERERKLKKETEKEKRTASDARKVRER